MAKGKRVKIKSGDKYGMLTVLEEIAPHISPCGNKVRRFKCQCDCGNTTIVLLNNLRNGNTSSCGCYNKQRIKETQSKINQYDLTGEVGVGYTSNGERFIFDKEDFEIIKDFCWFVNNLGYVVTRDRITSKIISFHRLVMHPKNKDELVDHINRDRLNNCKSNLRVCSHDDNMKNRSIHKNNTSGILGVTWNEPRKKWEVQIRINGRCTYIGLFTSKAEAIRVRIKAEIEFYKEYAPTYNYFTEEQRQAILSDRMPSKEIVEILRKTNKI